MAECSVRARWEEQGIYHRARNADDESCLVWKTHAPSEAVDSSHDDPYRPLSQFIFQVQKERDRILEEEFLSRVPIQVQEILRPLHNSTFEHGLNRWKKSLLGWAIANGKERPDDQASRLAANATTAVLASDTTSAIQPGRDINSLAYDRVKHTWVRWDVWGVSWGVLPGIQWRHEQPLEDYDFPASSEGIEQWREWQQNTEAMEVLHHPIRFLPVEYIALHLPNGNDSPISLPSPYIERQLRLEGISPAALAAQYAAVNNNSGKDPSTPAGSEMISTTRFGRVRQPPAMIPKKKEGTKRPSEAH